MRRLCRIAFVAAAALGLACASAERQSVLLATTRNGWIDVVDPGSLQVLGRLWIGAPVESAAAIPDGRTLLVRKALASEPERCCGLFRLDLAARSLAALLSPASSIVATPDGHRIFVQRGAVGVDVFDGETFARLPTMEAPGNYDLHPSPDGHWVVGTTNWQGPSLDIFDAWEGTLVRRLRLPFEARGAWLNGGFYLYGFDGRSGRLWKVSPDTTELDAGIPVALPDLATGCGFVLQIPQAADGRLVVYEAFGHKLDRRPGCRGQIPGGAYEVDPEDGKMIARLVPAMHFGRLVSEGRFLYALDLKSPDWSAPRLVKIDGTSGAVVVERTLEDGVWNLSTADIPVTLVPHQTIPIESK